MTPKPGDILQGGFWPELVRELTVQAMGQRYQLEAVGLNSSQFFPKILSQEDLNRVQVLPESARDFSGRSEPFFLAIEGHRIRFACQFDLLYAVNVSQADPFREEMKA